MTPVEPWLFRLDPPPARLADLLALLDPAERAQAASFRHHIHRRRFVARRGQLRELLAAHTGVAADALPFTRARFGKPALEGHALRFNTSSAGALGLCVLADAVEVGCDLAVEERGSTDDGLACLFSPAEQRALAALPAGARARARLAVWTRKEAYLKALGLGLEGALDAFDVPVAEDAVRTDMGDGWTLAGLPVPRPFLAALVVRAAPGGFALLATRVWEEGGVDQGEEDELLPIRRRPPSLKRRGRG